MNNRKSNSGFSLMETVIATAIVATTGLVLIAILGEVTLQTSDLRQGAALRRTVATIRNFMRSADFEEMYLKAQNTPPALVIYDYNADEKDVRADGSLEPSNDSSRSTLISAARWADDPELSHDLAAVPDFVFRAIIEPIDDDLPSDSVEYENATLPLKVSLWESTVDSVQNQRETSPDHIFYLHVFR